MLVTCRKGRISGPGSRPTMASVQLGPCASNQRENLPNEIEDSVGVRHPVHGADKNKVGIFVGLRLRREVPDIDTGGNGC